MIQMFAACMCTQLPVPEVQDTRDISLNWCHAHSHTHTRTQEYVCFSDFVGLKPYLKDYDYDYSEYSKKSVDYGDKKVRMEAFAQSCCSIVMLHNVLYACISHPGCSCCL